MEAFFTLEEIEKTAKEFIEYLQEKKVVAFHGNMGAGKTTFIKEVCRQMGVRQNVSSPTFSIINEYITKYSNQIFHIDVYRLKDLEEAIQAGVEDCVYSGSLCFIEWPEKIFSILPVDTVQVFIEPVDEDKRRFICKLPSQ